MSAARVDEAEGARDGRPTTRERADRRPGAEPEPRRWTDDHPDRYRPSIESPGATREADPLDLELWFG